jgi:hypothetical protein
VIDLESKVADLPRVISPDELADAIFRVGSVSLTSQSR